MLTTGWVKLPRAWASPDDGYYAGLPPEYVKVWVALLADVNYKVSVARDGTQVPANAKMFSLGKIARRCGVSVATVRGALRHAEARGMLTRVSTRRNTIITIVPAEAYEESEGGGSHEASHEPSHEVRTTANTNPARSAATEEEVRRKNEEQRSKHSFRHPPERVREKM